MASERRRRLLNLVIIAAAVLVMGAATVVYTNVTYGKLQQQQRAACAAAADLGSVPLPDKPPPSRLAVRLVTDNRGAWYGLGCGGPGSLPVPPGLAKWSAKYGIPVNGKRP